jgi:pilus assembly protein Flp/PilA
MGRRIFQPRFWRAALRDRRGVTALEYGLIVSALAIVLVAIFTALGPQLAAVFTAVGKKL